MLKVTFAFLQWLSCSGQQLLKMHEEVKIKDYLHRQKLRPFCGSSRTLSSSFSWFSCLLLSDVFVMKVRLSESAQQSLASDRIQDIITVIQTSHLTQHSLPATAMQLILNSAIVILSPLRERLTFLCLTVCYPVTTVAGHCDPCVAANYNNLYNLPVMALSTY